MYAYCSAHLVCTQESEHSFAFAFGSVSAVPTSHCLFCKSAIMSRVQLSLSGLLFCRCLIFINFQCFHTISGRHLPRFSLLIFDLTGNCFHINFVVNLFLFFDFSRLLLLSFGYVYKPCYILLTLIDGYHYFMYIYSKCVSIYKFLLVHWGCREHFVSGCWHSSGRDRGRFPRESAGIYFGSAASWRPCNLENPHQGPVPLS